MIATNSNSSSISKQMHMKTFTLTITMLLFIHGGLYAQGSMMVRGGGAVTVNGNTVINPPVFVCGNPLTDLRDGKTYSTVLIGTQCWMGQNLNCGTRIDGTTEQTNNSILEKYCYNDNVNYCNSYGGLYQWNEAMQYSTTEGTKGICPADWHLPTDAEWTTLTTYLDGVNIAGGKLKEAGLNHWAQPNTGATNSSGFTALPGGWGTGSGGYTYVTYHAAFWSSTQDNATHSWKRSLNNDDRIVNWLSSYYTYSFSIRCMKD
jgi:uncharacterized protein (TIGR02145 family)